MLPSFCKPHFNHEGFDEQFQSVGANAESMAKYWGTVKVDVFTTIPAELQKTKH